MPKITEAVIGSSWFVSSMIQIVKTEIDKNMEKSPNGRNAVGNIRRHFDYLEIRTHRMTKKDSRYIKDIANKIV